MMHSYSGLAVVGIILILRNKATDIYFLSIAKICWHRTASSLISKLFLKSCSTLVALASCSKHKSQYSIVYLFLSVQNGGYGYYLSC